MVGLLFATNFFGFAPAFYRFYTEYLWYLNPLLTAGESAAKPNVPEINLNTHAATSFIFILIYKAQFLVTGPALLYLFRHKTHKKDDDKKEVVSSKSCFRLSLGTMRSLHKKLGYVATLPLVALYALHTIYLVFRNIPFITNSADNNGSNNDPGLQMWHYWWGLGSVMSAIMLLYHSVTAVWILQQGKASPLTLKERQRAHINHMISACINFNIPGGLRACGMAVQSLVLQTNGGLVCDYMGSSGYVTVLVMAVVIPSQYLIRWSVFGTEARYPDNRYYYVVVAIDVAVGLYTGTLFQCVDASVEV